MLLREALGMIDYELVGDIDRLDAIVTDRAPRGEWMEAARGKRIKMIYPKDNMTVLAALEE